MTLIETPRDPDGSDIAARHLDADPFWRLLPARMPRRWWLFRPFDRLARNWPVFRGRKGVLVVRMDGIGDMVLFRNALDHLPEALGVAPDEITVLGCDSWGGLADRLFAGYRVVTLNEHRFAKSPWYRFATALRVRRLNPAVTLNDSYFRRPLMADGLAWIAGAPETIVSLPYMSDKTRAVFTWYLSQASRIVDTGPYPTHETERHAAFAEALAGRPMVPPTPSLDWDAPPPAFAQGGPYVVLNPGSNEHGRRWPFANYLEIARRCVAQGLRVAVIGGPKDPPPAAGRAGLAALDGVHDLIGRTDLPGLLDLLRHARAVVSNDTGPMHLAIALGTPTVAIVGGGHFGCFVPYPERVTPSRVRFLWTRMDCQHCFWSCPRRAAETDSFPCVAAVETDDVWAEVQALL